MRFTSNGYRAEPIAVEEYDSLFATTTTADVWNDLDGLIARLLAKSHADKVELVGHSLGTADLAGLPRQLARAGGQGRPLREPRRRAGRGAAGWRTDAGGLGEGNSAQRIVGATNVYQPDHSHVQVATSAETFERDVPVLHRPCAEDDPHRRRNGTSSLSGRADLFPSNAGAGGHDAADLGGQRPHGVPQGPPTPRPRSRSGPTARGARSSGAATSTTSSPSCGPARPITSTYEPFIRSDRLIRLLTQVPGTGLDPLREKSATTVEHHVRSLQGAVGRPGRAERRAHRQRPERPDPGHRPAGQAAQRPVRLRPQSRRRDRPHRADPGVRRAARSSRVPTSTCPRPRRRTAPSM